MASSKDYLDYVLEQLSGLEGIAARAMMGEYVLYCGGKVVGGVYDDRLLLKDTPAARRLLAEAGLPPERELPYEGRKRCSWPTWTGGSCWNRWCAALPRIFPPRRKNGRTRKFSYPSEGTL